MAVTAQGVFLLVMTSYGLVGCYKCFGGVCYLPSEDGGSWFLRIICKHPDITRCQDPEGCDKRMKYKENEEKERKRK
jgi:hypothetical protein